MLHRSPARVWVLAATLLGSAGVVGCSSGSKTESGPEAFTEHRIREAATPTKRVGEDCKVGGFSDCLSRICVHFKPSPQEGYVCSQRCNGLDWDCPMRWVCRSVFPGPNNSYCFPPANWQFGVARSRALDAGPRVIAPTGKRLPDRGIRFPDGGSYP